MTYGLDTSVVLRILTNRPLKLATNAIVRIHRMQLAGDSFFISDLVLSETYFALQDHYKVSKESALAAIKALCDNPGFVVSDAAKESLATPNLAKANPGFADRMIHGEYFNKGYRTFSCEKSFGRMPLTEVIKETDKLDA